LYDSDMLLQRTRMAIRILLASFFSLLFIAFIFYIMNIRPLGTITLGLNIIIISVLAVLWRWIVATWAQQIRPPLRVAIFGKDQAGQKLATEIEGNGEFSFMGFLDELWEVEKGKTAHYADILSIVNRHNIQSLVVTNFDAAKEGVRKALFSLKTAGISIFELPVFCEIYFRRIPVEHIEDSWFIFSRITGVSRSLYNTKLKRGLDIVASFLGLIVLAPIMVMAALLIKIDSPGPVLFMQRRIGMNERPFTLYKFRTMIVGKEKDRANAGSENDPRITKVGKFLRKCRIDEIPQFWNVLKGDMSLIGPRALMEEEVNEFKESVPFFYFRHTVRPGITGWAQVNYRHGTTHEDALKKLEYDLYYIKHLSATLDLLIALKTINVMLFRKGAR
ncbi:MAG: sugar transferase, partial [Syntrophales bacterium]|nr:sugar transferase [Syntrophales bacterium]